MSVDIILGSLALAHAWLEADEPARKVVIHEYDWTSSNYVTPMGLAPRRIRLTGVCENRTARDQLEQVLETQGALNLYFPSSLAATSADRYYQVHVVRIAWQPASADVWRYEIDFVAPDPYPYDTATGARVWG